MPGRFAEECLGRHAGANIRAGAMQEYNISIVLMDGEITDEGIYGLRVDYWDEASLSFPPESSLFFYDAQQELMVSDSSPHAPLALEQAHIQPAT